MVFGLPSDSDDVLLLGLFLSFCLAESKLVAPAAAQGDGVPPAEGGGAAAAGGGPAAGQRPTAEGPSDRRGEPGEEDPAQAAAGGGRGQAGGELHPPGRLRARGFWVCFFSFFFSFLDTRNSKRKFSRTLATS